MPTALLIGLAAAGGTALATWLACLLDPARAWDFRPVAEDEPPAPAPPAWPRVAVVVPAHDEADVLPRALPALLAQDYPGAWGVVLVDDRSRDGTGEVARALGEAAAAAPGGAAGRLEVLAGAPLPDGWAGKVDAIAQGVERVAALDLPPAYVLLTDADIRHAPGSLRALVAEAERDGLALTSRMARLHCASAMERLLVPPFVLFFNLLYPMRRVNDPRSRFYGAAGGCVLVRLDALAAAGGMAAIRGEIIDDVNLARAVQGQVRRGAPGRPIRLALSRSQVTSLRAYTTLGPAWRMVRRTAFTQLRHSWALLALTVFGLALLFALPVALVPLGAAVAATGEPAWGTALTVLGAAGWGATALVHRPATRFYGLAWWWALTLPVAGVLYGGMTLDSGRRHLLGHHRAW